MPEPTASLGTKKLDLRIYPVVIPRNYDLQSRRLYFHIAFSFVRETSAGLRDIAARGKGLDTAIRSCLDDWPKLIAKHFPIGKEGPAQLQLVVFNNVGAVNAADRLPIKRELKDPGAKGWKDQDASELWRDLFDEMIAHSIDVERVDTTSTLDAAHGVALGQAFADGNGDRFAVNPDVTSDLRPGYRLLSPDARAAALGSMLAKASVEVKNPPAEPVAFRVSPRGA